jgi:Holliday junction DNA helicase RuvA
MAASELGNAIRGNDVARLTKIPGIGRKTAERLALELRDKLPTTSQEVAAVAPAYSAVQEDVLSALVNLGYQRTAAEKALASVAKDGSFDAMFRGALAAMNK